MKTLGVDISRWQGGAFPFKQAKAEGRKFCIIQAGYGTSSGATLDSQLAHNVAGARAAGLNVSFYFFAYPDRSSAAVQADAFWKLIKPYYKKGSDLWPSLDFEETFTSWAWVEAFMARLAALAGGAIFYTYLGFIQAHPAPAGMAKHPLWLADYTTIEPASPAPWPHISIWQKSDRDGVQGLSVDLDVAEVGLSTLRSRTLLPHWHLIVEAGGVIRGNVRVGNGRSRKLLNPVWLAGLAKKYGKLRILRRRGK